VGDVYYVETPGLGNGWHHIAAVFDNGDVHQSRIYIDGVEQTLTQLTGSFSGPPDNSRANFNTNTARIGGRDVNSEFSLEGQIDNVVIWHGERSASQIAADMNGINPDQPALVAFYSFENTSSGTSGVIDSSGNGHHGTLSGLTVASNIIANDIPQLVDRTLYGLSISDSGDPDDEFTVTASALHGTVLPNAGTGTLTEVNRALAAGVTYTPDNTGPSNDTVTMTVTDSQGRSGIMHFIFNVTGEGNVTLEGTAGKDTIFGTGFSDTLSGNGGANTFVFGDFGGQDAITDFDVLKDGVYIDQASSGFTSVADMLANHTADVSGSAVITGAGGATIVFANVTTATLQQHAGDFHLM
jgi:Ca2+-binding RTX toxin-like protein